MKMSASRGVLTRGIVSTAVLVLLSPALPQSFQLPTVRRVVNSATGESRLAPGVLAEIFGSDLELAGPLSSSISVVASLQKGAIQKPAAVDGAAAPPVNITDLFRDGSDNGRQASTIPTSVLVGGQQAAVLYQSLDRLTVQIPTQLQEGASFVQVLLATTQSSRFNVEISAFAPGLLTAKPNEPAGRFFTSTNAIPIVEPAIDASNPATPGQEIAVEAIGLGATSPTVPTGQRAPFAPLAITTTPPKVTVAGAAARVRDAFLLPGSIGVYRIRFTVPEATANGTHPVIVEMGTGKSNSVTLSVVSNAACTYTLSPVSTSLSANGGSGSFSIQTGTTCPWTVTANASWLSADNPSGRGPGSVTYRVAGNAGSAERRGTLSVEGQTFTVNQAASGVATTPSLRLSSSALLFNLRPDQRSDPQTLTIASTIREIPLSISSDQTWLSVSEDTGRTPLVLQVAVNSAGLAAGDYRGTLVISSPDAFNSPQQVSVALSVGSRPTLQVAPSGLTFIATDGGSAPSAQSIQVSGSSTAVPFDATVSLAPGSEGDWLSVTPAEDATPAELSVAVKTAGLRPGNYGGTIIIRSAAASNSPQTVPVTLTILAAPPVSSVSLVVLQSAMIFNHQINGTPPGSLDVVLTTTGGLLPFQARAAISTPAGGRWLSVSPQNGSAPGVVKISANPAGLDPGYYDGVVTIAAQGGSTAALPVRLVVTNPIQPVLNVDTEALTFSFSQTGMAEARQLTVVNPSNNLIRFNVETVTDKGSGWLKVSTDRSDTSATNPATILVSTDPAGLEPGAYSGRLRLTSALVPAPVDVPVKMVVSQAQRRLKLSQSGLTFSVVAGAPGGVIPQEIGVLNTGRGTMPWKAEAVIPPGQPAWLQVSPATGSSTPGGEIPKVKVSVTGAGLNPGEYGAQVMIAGEGADDSPFPVAVTLRVLPQNTPAAPVLSPTGLIFTGVAGGASPAEQPVIVLNPSGQQVTAGSSSLTLDGSKWLSYSPESLRFTGSDVNRVNMAVRVNTANMLAGTYEGRITVSFPGGVNRVLNVLLVLYPAGGTGAANQAGRNAGAQCVPTKYVPLFTSVEDQFSATAGAPTSTEILLIDDCGNPVDKASVGATFTNRDRSLTLVPLGGGRWSATWLPATRSSVTVNVTAIDAGQQAQNGVVPATGLVRDALSAPLLDPARSVVNSAIPALGAGSPVAPGTAITIFGDRLGALSNEQAETVVTLGSRVLTLAGVSEKRIDAVIPNDIDVNTSYQLVVKRGQLVSLPEQLAVVTTQPAIFTQDGSGRGIGQVFTTTGGSDLSLVGPSNPLEPGDRMAVRCTGLGKFDAEGRKLANAATISVGGRVIDVAEVREEKPGVFLLTATVPTGLRKGDDTPMTIQVGGNTSPAVLVSVR